MSTCNGLDLQTLGSQHIMSNNLPGHWEEEEEEEYIVHIDTWRD